VSSYHSGLKQAVQSFTCVFPGEALKLYAAMLTRWPVSCSGKALVLLAQLEEDIEGLVELLDEHEGEEESDSEEESDVSESGGDSDDSEDDLDARSMAAAAAAVAGAPLPVSVSDAAAGGGAGAAAADTDAAARPRANSSARPLPGAQKEGGFVTLVVRTLLACAQVEHFQVAMGALKVLEKTPVVEAVVNDATLRVDVVKVRCCCLLHPTPPTLPLNRALPLLTCARSAAPVFRVSQVAESVAFNHWSGEVQMHASDVYVMVKRTARKRGVSCVAPRSGKE
jgi:hypothetical protein